jgi:hypothetical protein
MCKEMPVIPVHRVVDPKRIIGKKWRAKEEERHKGSLTKKLSICSAMTKAFLGITYSLTHKVIPVSWLFRRR